MNSDSTPEPESKLDPDDCNWAGTEHESIEGTRRAASSQNGLTQVNGVPLELLDDLFASNLYFDGIPA